MTTADTFWKLKTFISICYDKKKKSIGVDEVMSMFMSSFSGKEIIAFRKEQSRLAKKKC